MSSPHVTSLLCWMLGALPALAQQKPRVIESYGKLPLSFEANRGQTDARVKFLSRGSGYTLFLTEDSAVLSLQGKKANAALRMKLLGANAHAVVTGADGLPGKSNYFAGNDPKQWRTNVPTYASVKYTRVYPGIDLVYHGNQRLLEYDFVVAPGADPRAIDLRFQGAKKLSVTSEGALVLKIGDREVIEHAPVVYQDFAGCRKNVAGRYVLRGKYRVGFEVADYDGTQPLVIDPTLVYSTYLGDSMWGGSIAIAVDALGNAYITGSVQSPNFPTTPGGFQTSIKAGQHAFVAKLNAVGSALLYSTYLGGSGLDLASAISVDTSGNAYVTGHTSSVDFPTTSTAFQKAFGGSPYDSFVTKLNGDGSALIYSTYLGGGDWDVGTGIAVDASGHAYVTGWTNSSNYPTTPGAFQTNYMGRTNYTVTFVTKLNVAGSALEYSTYLGESAATAITVDAFGNAYIVGNTLSYDFPITPGAFQTTLLGYAENGNEPSNVFVTKLNANGSTPVYSTYLGSGYEQATAMAVDASGNVYVAGFTSSSDFPTTPGAFQTIPRVDQFNTFLTKLNPVGAALVYSSYLPFSVSGVAVDAYGNSYLTGSAASGFPTSAGAFQTNFAGVIDAYVAKLNATGSALVYSSYLGGTGQDIGLGITLDKSGNVYVAGGTTSLDFPTTPGAFHTSGQSFVTKLDLGEFVSSGPKTNATINGSFGNMEWYRGDVTIALAATDPDSPISATYYSLDGGPYMGYGAPFLISGEGVHQIMFYSVDAAGHRESAHGQWIKIDTTKPVSRVAALPATVASPNFRLQWSDTDALSGIQDCTIFASDNGGPFTPWLAHVATSQAYYSGSVGHTYSFYSIATDNAGNQDIKTAADTTTHVPSMPGDANGDGKINCADLAIVKASMGKSAGQTGFDPRADVNHDGVVNVLDLAIVSQKLIPGTTCP